MAKIGIEKIEFGHYEFSGETDSRSWHACSNKYGKIGIKFFFTNESNCPYGCFHFAVNPCFISGDPILDSNNLPLTKYFKFNGFIDAKSRCEWVGEDLWELPYVPSVVITGDKIINGSGKEEPLELHIIGMTEKNEVLKKLKKLDDLVMERAEYQHFLGYDIPYDLLVRRLHSNYFNNIIISVPNGLSAEEQDIINSEFESELLSEGSDFSTSIFGKIFTKSGNPKVHKPERPKKPKPPVNPSSGQPVPPKECDPPKTLILKRKITLALVIGLFALTYIIAIINRILLNQNAALPIIIQWALWFYSAFLLIRLILWKVQTWNYRSLLKEYDQKLNDYQNQMNQYNLDYQNYQKEILKYNQSIADWEKQVKIWNEKLAAAKAKQKIYDDEYRKAHDKAKSFIEKCLIDVEQQIDLNGDIISEHYYEKLDKIISLIECGRADTVKEAINLYEQEMEIKRHHAAMEAEAARKSDAAEQQAAAESKRASAEEDRLREQRQWQNDMAQMQREQYEREAEREKQRTKEAEAQRRDDLWREENRNRNTRDAAERYKSASSQYESAKMRGDKMAMRSAQERKDAAFADLQRYK